MTPPVLLTPISCLSDDSRISLREMRSTARQLAPSLVVLSACETGIVGVESASNEYEGLADALLGLGAQGVVASLWPVNEYPTMLLMWRFYRELAMDVAPAAALRTAQLWVAGATGAELVKIVDQEFMAKAHSDPIARPAMGNFRSFLAQNPHTPIYADPFYWAGFFSMGAIGI